jgi:hypothetical protein
MLIQHFFYSKQHIEQQPEVRQNLCNRKKQVMYGQFRNCKHSNKYFILRNDNKHTTYQNAMMSTRTTMAIWMNLLEQTSSLSMTFEWLHLLCFKLAAESLLVTENDYHLWDLMLLQQWLLRDIFWDKTTCGSVDTQSNNKCGDSTALALGYQRWAAQKICTKYVSTIQSISHY